MPKVKLFLANESYDDYSSWTMLGCGVSDWEEISNEDLKLLQSKRWELNGLFSGQAVTIVVQDEISLQVRISEIKAKLEKQEEAKRLHAALTKQQAEKAKQERLLRKKAKTEAEELALLAELEKKYKGTGG